MRRLQRTAEPRERALLLPDERAVPEPERAVPEPERAVPEPERAVERAESRAELRACDATEQALPTCGEWGA